MTMGTHQVLRQGLQELDELEALHALVMVLQDLQELQRELDALQGAAGTTGTGKATGQSEDFSARSPTDQRRLENWP